MNTKTLILAVSTALLLVGCATDFPSSLSDWGYHPVKPVVGGYSDTACKPDVFRVVFIGSGYTSAERAQDFAFLRACELTLQGGFIYFAIVDEQNSTYVSTFATPGNIETTANGRGYDSGTIYFDPSGGYYSGSSSATVHESTTYTPPETYFIYKPRTELLIQTFKNKPSNVPDSNPVFDAAFLQQSLKQKYPIKVK